MTLIDSINYYRLVWRTALPHIPEPSPEDAIRWCPYPLATVELAILRVARRFAPGKVTADFDPADAYRYVTATCGAIKRDEAVREAVKLATASLRKTVTPQGIRKDSSK